MCKQHTTATQVKLAIQRSDGREHAPVDPCIANLVQALNDAGIATIASCCGHGRRPGNIALSDGRELIICPDYETSRIAEKSFPPVNFEFYRYFNMYNKQVEND